MGEVFTPDSCQPVAIRDVIARLCPDGNELMELRWDIRRAKQPFDRESHRTLAERLVEAIHRNSAHREVCRAGEHGT